TRRSSDLAVAISGKTSGEGTVEHRRILVFGAAVAHVFDDADHGEERLSPALAGSALVRVRTIPVRPPVPAGTSTSPATRFSASNPSGRSEERRVGKEGRSRGSAEQ